MCDFFFFSMDVGFHLSGRRGRQEQRVKGLRLVGEILTFCFYDPEGAQRVCRGGFFFFFLVSLVSFEGEGPSLPRVITPHMNVWWWGTRASAHKTVSVKPLLLLV